MKVYIVSVYIALYFYVSSTVLRKSRNRLPNQMAVLRNKYLVKFLSYHKFQKNILLTYYTGITGLMKKINTILLMISD